MKFAYAVTTCQYRLGSEVLNKTLQSLKASGFDAPRVFVDAVQLPIKYYEELGEQYTLRIGPPVGPFGAWMASVWELVTRDPEADRYVIFQDDIVVSAGLRDFLTWTRYPEQGYCNLCTYPKNAQRGRSGIGWFLTDQKGLGAQALMFDNAAMTALLSSKHLIDRVTSKNPRVIERRWKYIDGAIVTAMRSEGYAEYVHDPSPVSHTGEDSAKAHYNPLDEIIRPQPPTALFRGEDFDLRTLL